MRYGRLKTISWAIFALSLAACQTAKLAPITLCDWKPEQGGLVCVPEDTAKPAFVIPPEKIKDFYGISHGDFKLFSGFCRLKVKGAP